MAIRIAIVGPGRVGAALGRRWREGGAELIGFHGGRGDAAARACAFAGGGRPLGSIAEVRGAAAVLLAVPDGVLRAVARAAAGAVGPDALWLHCSGYHDLAPLAPLASAGARIASLHPACPFPDAEAGYRAAAGKPAVIEAEPLAERLTVELAERAGLRPIRFAGGDRRAYHALCALAANGGTALVDLVAGAFVTAAGLDERAAAELAVALLGGAVDQCRARGTGPALTGPVVRGEHAVVAGHLEALGGSAAGRAYRELMRRAVSMAAARGALDGAAAAAFEELLAGDG